MKGRVKVGQQYQDLDPRRVERIGTVVRVRRYSVGLRWNTSGHTTMVSLRHLEANGSRGYVLIKEATAPPVTSVVVRPTTAADRRAGYDEEGVALWTCLVCGTVGRLRRPWRELLWTRGPWAERSTVVCSDACHRRVTGGRDAR